MNDVNSQIKFKVLSNLKKHMESRMGERLKPKAPLAPSIGEAPPVAPGMGAPGMGQQGGLGGDDAKRLMDMYSSLK